MKIRYGPSIYGCITNGNAITVNVLGRYSFREVTYHTEEAVRQWLGDNGLPRRVAKRLLDAAIRNTGPYADPQHQRRIAQLQNV
jgi:hypothetical protein